MIITAGLFYNNVENQIVIPEIIRRPIFFMFG